MTMVRAMMGRAAVLAASLLLLGVGFAQAQGTEPGCGASVEPTPAAVAYFTPTYVYEGSDTMAMFLAGAVRDPDGGKAATLFVRTDDGWKGVMAEEQADFVEARITYGSRALLFSMIDVEGPGHSYTVLSTADGFKTINCGVIPPPPVDLDPTEYMRIISVEMDDKGNGLVRGTVTFNDEAPDQCFASTTGDGGKTWTVPSASAPCIADTTTALSPVAEDEGPMHDLRMAAGP